ncbi:hypothetical protein P7C70_g5292, partial [Phenoliferia sp. Uapishka_3]
MSNLINHDNNIVPSNCGVENAAGKDQQVEGRLSSGGRATEGARGDLGNGTDLDALARPPTQRGDAISTPTGTSASSSGPSTLPPPAHMSPDAKLPSESLKLHDAPSQNSTSPSSSFRASRESDGVPLPTHFASDRPQLQTPGSFQITSVHDSVANSANGTSGRVPELPSHKNSTEYSAKDADEKRFGEKPNAAHTAQHLLNPSAPPRKITTEADRPRPPMPYSSDSVLSVPSLQGDHLEDGAPIGREHSSHSTHATEADRPRPPMPHTSDSVLSVAEPLQHGELNGTHHGSSSLSKDPIQSGTTESHKSPEDLMTPAQRYASQNSDVTQGEQVTSGFKAPHNTHDGGLSTVTSASSESTVGAENQHKPSIIDKLTGTLEKTLGKIQKDDEKVALGEAKKSGNV